MSFKRISDAFFLCCFAYMAVWLWLALPGCKDVGTPLLPEKPFCPETLGMESYYYYFDQKKPLWLRTSEIAILFKTPKDSGAVAAFAAAASALLRPDSVRLLYDERPNPIHEPPWLVWGVQLVPGVTSEMEKGLLDALKGYEDIHFATPSYEADSVFRYKIWLTTEFSVKLLDTTKLTELHQLNSQFGITQRPDRWRPGVYYLEVPKTLCRNSLEMSNYYHEHYRWLIEWVAPNWLF